MKRFFSLGITAVIALGALVGVSSPSYGFGSIDAPTLFGQNAEHQHITESLQQADPRWDNLTIQLLAGNSGNYGAVAAADRITDSSIIPIVGLGPGFKHCDDGDYLAGGSYPQSQATAQANLNECARYYQYVLERAVDYAGMLVTEDLTVDTRVFEMTSGSKISPDRVCKFRYSMSQDNNTKCDVLNGIGRALHVAEDVWSHTNWADYSYPSQPVGVTNPPGLANTTVPNFLRFPAEAIVPGDLISGCDDSANKGRCKKRVAHSAIAKDNGVITLASAVPNSSYPRGSVTVDGITNFQRAVAGAKMQVASTLHDFEQEVLKRYGVTRGAMIMDVLFKDSLGNTTFNAVAVAAPENIDQSLANDSLSEEFASDPAQDAATGTFDKETDPDHSSLEAEGSSGREATGLGTDVVTPYSENTSNWFFALLVGMAVISAGVGGWLWNRARKSSTH